MIDHADLAKKLTVPDASNPNYCSNFYKGLYVQKQDQDRVAVSACCINTVSPDAYSTVDFVNNSYLQSQRRLDHRPAGCNECWRQEAAGTRSYREQANQWYQEHFPDQDPYRVQLLRMDYNLDPVCNAKCIICGSWFSSLWAQEDREFGEYFQIRSFREVKNNDRVRDIDFSSLRKIYFNGGEPLLSREMVAILEQIRTAQGSLSNLHCQLSTNGSIRPDDDLVRLWQECEKVDIWVSLDAVGQQFEYIRYPLSFDSVWQNCVAMGNLGSNIFVGFSFTIGVHNLDHYGTALEWINNHKGDINGADHGLNHCNGDLAVDKASVALLQSWKQKYHEDGPQWQRDLYQQIAGEHGQPNNDIWLQRLKMIDHRRGLNWRQSLPELAMQEKLASKTQ